MCRLPACLPAETCPYHDWGPYALSVVVWSARAGGSRLDAVVPQAQGVTDLVAAAGWLEPDSKGSSDTHTLSQKDAAGQLNKPAS